MNRRYLPSRRKRREVGVAPRARAQQEAFGPSRRRSAEPLLAREEIDREAVAGILGGADLWASRPARTCHSAALDDGGSREHACVMATVHEVIEFAAQLSEEERRVVVDAIAPKESVEELSRAWSEEISRRAARVRAGESKGRPADEVFDRIEAKLRAR
ncbi:MAG: addiction module protein [Polyangiaceae bacterium]